MWFKSPGTGSAGSGLRFCSSKLAWLRKGVNNYTERRRGTQLPMARVWSLRDLKVAPTDALGLVGAGFSLRLLGSGGGLQPGPPSLLRHRTRSAEDLPEKREDNDQNEAKENPPERAQRILSIIWFMISRWGSAHQPSPSPGQ